MLSPFSRFVAYVVLSALVLCSVRAEPISLDIDAPEDHNTSVPIETLFTLFDQVDSKTWLPTQEDVDRELKAPSNRSQCCQCVKTAAKCILKHAVKHAKDICKQGKYPHIKHQCEILKNHKKIGLGIIMAHVRPFSLGHAYCLGKGDCKPKEEVVSSEELDDEEEALMQSEVLLQLIGSDGELASKLNLDQTPTDTASLDLLAVDGDQKGCTFCIHLTSKFVMLRTVSHVKEFCKRAEGHGKAWCKWAHKNKEVAFGTLLVHVRPGEWACGFCFGKGVCHHQDAKARGARIFN